MIWLNYQHLYYFWSAVRKGSIVAAGETLLLSPSTVSTQIHSLENMLGQKLMKREGKRLVATETGQLVFGYAERIFSLGGELLDTVRNDSGRGVQTVRVGIVDALPKLLAHWLIEPALRLKDRTRVICREGANARLLVQLAIGDLDVVLSDVPAPVGIKVRTFTRTLGNCGVAFLASHKLMRVRRKGFPRCLDGTPMLIPTEGASLRSRLDEWFESKRLRPMIVGEFDDHAMLRAFAETGEGVVPIPTLVARHFIQGGMLRELGRSNEIRVKFYGITTEKKLEYSPVVAICDRSRRIPR